MSVSRIAPLALLVALMAATIVREVCAHGKLMDPVNRSSAWRKGLSALVNYDDNQLYCGGVHQDKDRPGTRQCGVCGDSYNAVQPRPNENGGFYGRGIIVKKYRRGQRIKALVDLTASHKGFFEFSVCPLQGPRDIETEQCFKRYPLKFTGRSSIAKATLITDQSLSKRKSEPVSNDIRQSKLVVEDSVESNRILGSSRTNVTEKLGSLTLDDYSQASLDSIVRASASESKDYRVPVQGPGNYIVELILPQGLSCNHCSLRWEYTGGNKWGVCPDGSRKLGCGPQETFRNCADISIQ